MSITGYVHSTESCGTVDGPGIRYVVFMQGCPMRCRYCHNPDTWEAKKGEPVTTDKVLEDILKYKSYMKFSKGGVTITGGEPLLQADFVNELLYKCKKKGIHTVLDTSGTICNDTTIALLDNVDMCLLDIKNYDKDIYHYLTGCKLDSTLKFAEALRNKNVTFWVRYVLVPSLTDNLDAIASLSSYLDDFPNLYGIELLPFHKMGEFKWQELNLEYTLADTQPPSAALVAQVKELFSTNNKLVIAF